MRFSGIASLILTSACTTPALPSQVASRENTPIMRVYHSRCGACHEPVKPGTRTSDELTQALAKHRKRVRLTEQQWADLTFALAASTH
jgi:predicted nucleic acid-binding Zn ribbon protein